MPESTVTITRFDDVAGIWRTVAVPVTSGPRTRPARRTVRHGAPADRSGLSNGSPFAYGMSDTAFAPCDGFADMRTYLPEPAIRTHRPAVVVPAGKASDATAGTRWHDLGR